MKINKKILAKLLSTTLLLSLMTGCSTEVSDKDKGAIQSEILEFAVEGGQDLSYLDELIKDNIDLFSQEEKDELIDAYVLNMFSFLDDLNNKLYTVGYELEDVVETYKVDISTPSTFDRIPDIHATVRGFLEELSEEGFTLDSENEYSEYFIVVDMQKVIDKYGNHMSKSFKDYLTFNVYEMTEVNFMDIEKEEINIDEVINRIITLEEGLKTDKEQGYPFVDKWTASLEYYYSVLFGLSHDYFVSSEFIKDDVYKKYESIIENHKDTGIANATQFVLDVLDNTNKRVDDTTNAELSKVLDLIYSNEIIEAINILYPESIIPTEDVEIDAEVEEAE